MMITARHDATEVTLMESNVPHLKWAVINCHDEERLAEFWSAFLDVRIKDRSENFV